MRRTLYVLAGLLSLVLLALGASALYVRSAQPDYADGAELPGLLAPVEVWRDSLGVPHVWAESEVDLFRAMGYTHAQDRLWQMELLRRVADGRLAEVLGEPVVETDRFLRTVGMGRLAAANEAALSDEERVLLQAYADGVNAWIDSHPGALPPEFVMLRTAPEPWTVRNSLSIGKIMAWDLADWNQGLDLQRAVNRVGPELARELFPSYPAWGPTILESQGDSGTAATSPDLRTSSAPLPRIPDLAARLLESASISRASNAWVIGGSRTRSGKPILANDMHLALRAPSLWYLAALHGGGIEAVGMTLPGVPLVVAGHTRGVAWGFTNAMVDDVDFFVERVNPGDSTQYLTPDGWRAFEVRAETIQVKGADPVVQRVRSTRHGPVLSDVESRASGEVMAMRWTAQDPSPEVRALYGMNSARSAAEFMGALRDFRSPHQNVVFADSLGTIGYWMSGRVPLRRSGDGVLPAPGWTDQHEWTGYLDWDDHPHAVDPPAGYIVTANNRQAGPGYPHHITSGWADPFRAMRIEQMVETGNDLTAEDVARQQMDVRDLAAVRYLPHAVAAAEAAGDSASARTLRDWTGEAREDSHAAALYYVWQEALRTKVGSDEFGGRAVFFSRDALHRVLDAGGGAWVDDVGTPRVETLEELAADALTEAAGMVGARTWGDLHSVRIEHPLGSVAALDGVLGLNIGPFPSPGSPFTVNVAHFGGRPPFVTTYGPSQRHVVDMSDPDGAGGFVIPTGQSGLPFSRHYRDQTQLWREGRLWRIPLDRDRAAARAVASMTLTPTR